MITYKQPGTTVEFSKYWTAIFSAKLLAMYQIRTWKSSVTIQTKAYWAVPYLMVLFIALFKSGLKMKCYIYCYHSEWSFRYPFPCSIIYYDLQGSAKFWVRW